MLHALVIMAQIVALAAGARHAIAESPVAADGFQIDGALDTFSNEDLIDAIIAAVPADLSADLDETTIEPSAAAGAKSQWTEEAPSGVDYPVTPTISLGVAYELEEIEDLTAAHIEMGTAGVDYTSHKVLVRAQWQFDLMP